MSSPVRRELLLGCGNRRKKILFQSFAREWSDLTTLDIDPACNPDVLFDLSFPVEGSHRIGSGARHGSSLPFDSDTFDELHAYEVLEHCGAQGDYRLLFKQFSEFWRVLKPGGHFLATVPYWQSLWAFGDPSHTRVINRGTLIFLDQDMYKFVGKSPMSDYRSIYRADFKIAYDSIHGEGDEKNYGFCLVAIKPARRAA